MRKNYQTPLLKVLYLDAAPLLQTTSLDKGGSSKANIGNGAEAWSKSFWGSTIDDDSPSSAGTSTFNEDE